MDITTIQQFLSVVRHGSFSAAARELDMVASSVSRQITQLETQLEVPLFVRTTRKLVLTEAGHIFENRARVILSALEEATLAVKDLDQNPKGTLRVTAPMAIGRLHLVKATIDYMTLWPEVNVEIDLSDQVVDLIEGDFDVAVRIGTLDDSTYVARRLGGIRRFVYGSPDYFEKNGIPLVPNDLKSHACLTFHPHKLSALWRESSEVWRFEKDGKLESVPVDGCFKTNTSEAIVQASVAGKGLIMMLDWIVLEHVQAGRLKTVLTDYVAAPYSGDAAAFAIYPAGRNAPAKVRSYIDHLQHYFETTLNH